MRSAIAGLRRQALLAALACAVAMGAVTVVSRSPSFHAPAGAAFDRPILVKSVALDRAPVANAPKALGTISPFVRSWRRRRRGQGAQSRAIRRRLRRSAVPTFGGAGASPAAPAGDASGRSDGGGGAHDARAGRGQGRSFFVGSPAVAGRNPARPHGRADIVALNERVAALYDVALDKRASRGDALIGEIAEIQRRIASLARSVRRGPGRPPAIAGCHGRKSPPPDSHCRGRARARRWRCDRTRSDRNGPPRRGRGGCFRRPECDGRAPAR